jgi:hypothetical protein
MALLWAGGCASGPNGSDSLTVRPPTPTVVPSSGTPFHPSPSASPNTLLQFHVAINDSGQFETFNQPLGYYVIAFNSFDQPIDVSNDDTFDNFVSWDGNNLFWYNRQTVPGNEQNFTFVPVAQLNENVSFSTDNHEMIVTFNINDPTSPLNVYIVTNQFTCHCMTTDHTGILGRVIDAFGPGPDLGNNPLYTVTVDKTVGAISPLPPNYPVDPLLDYITQPDLDPSFPYVDFDLSKFQVTAR